MNILYLYFGSASPVAKYEKILLHEISLKTEYKIDYWDWTGDLGLKYNPSEKWTKKNYKVFKSFYQELLIRSKRYDVVFIAQTEGILPEILDQIKTYKVYNTADDPDSSEHCSFPFVRHVDLIVHAGVNFDENTKINEMLLRKGAKSTYFMPIGFYDKMMPAIPNFDKQFNLRDIKLLYVGFPKVNKILPLVKYFGKNLEIFCRQLSPRRKLFWLVFGRKWIKPFEGSLVELYWRTQVGINCHHSFGPSNVRSYQLNATGVAQVLDCPEGNNVIYHDKEEILSYSSIDQAIANIELLINDSDLRYYISSQGYKKARGSYNREKLLIDLFDSISKTIN